MKNLIISMSKRELKRSDIIKHSLRKEITVKKAAQILNLSRRQIYNLRKAFKEEGLEGLIHGNRGSLSNRRMPSKEKKKIVKLLHKHYPDFGLTLVSDKILLKLLNFF